MVPQTCYAKVVDPLPDRADVVIVGGGFAGVATAWWLAERGVTDVVVLEREARLGLHASGRNAGLCRQIAEDDPWTARCARGARHLRDRFAGALRVTGSYLLVDDAVTLDELAARAARHGVRCAAASPAEVAARVPAMAGLPCAGALFVPDDGVIDVMSLVHAYAARARVVTDAAVTAVRPADDGAEVVTARGAVRAGVVVAAAGAWAGAIGALAGARDPDLAPIRRHLFLLDEGAGAPAPGDPYVWHVGAAEVYVRAGVDGLLACACDAVRTAPGDVAVDPAAAAQLAARLAPTPLAGRAITATWACQRTFAAGGAPLLGWDAEVPWLFWVAGLGGHGATTSSAIGEDAAAAISARLG
jgi:glycine/D-amino acid oxidase-like deaminating enzyme